MTFWLEDPPVKRTSLTSVGQTLRDLKEMMIWFVTGELPKPAQPSRFAKPS